MGVRKRAGVTLSNFFRPVLMKPDCSATPTPSMATSTMPSGAKPVKVVTMLARNSASPAPVSRLLTTTASPVRGLTRSKENWEPIQEPTQTISKA